MNDRAAPAPTGHWINNRYSVHATGSIPIIDPSYGEPFAFVARGGAAQIDEAVHAARAAFDGPWGKLAASERARVLHRLSQLLVEHADELTQLEMRDCGKPVRQARADAAIAARTFEFYGAAAVFLHGQTLPAAVGTSVLTWREPYGVCAHLLPWSDPLQIFSRSVGAALAAGNTCVVKPSEEACLSLLRVAELAADAGLPPGALNIVTGYAHEAGEALARHAGISHLSFAGSAANGAHVAQLCAPHHCPVTLALGGKSPQIVFADADLDAAVPALVAGIVHNSGQTCGAGARLLVDEPVYEQLLDRLATRFAALRVGPAARDLDCGPLISQKQLQRVWDFLSDAQHDGVEMMASGQIDDDAPQSGFYQAPALLRDVPPTHRIAREELLGPVLCAMKFTSDDEALALANDSPYGLVAGVWTRDAARQFRMARALRCGQVFVNHYPTGGGVDLPFGGVKASGYGREKGVEALYGYTQLKTVAIHHG